MARGTRTRLEEGIYVDRAGLAAVVKVGHVQREKRYPLETDRAVLRQWRADTKATLLRERTQTATQRADPRSLARSIAIYLKRRKGRPSYRADRSHLKAWLVPFKDRRRYAITPADLAGVIAQWTTAQVKPATIRHRVRCLREVYEALDGPGQHPCSDLVLPTVQTPTPMPVSHATIATVIASLAQGKRHPKGYGADPILSRARFLVYATTGQRPAQIGRALPGDVDLVRKVWFVRPAKGGDPIPLPLSADMITAWSVFIAANAWGPFDTTALAKLLRRHGWPAGIRPYALRHTFAIDLLLSGTDLGDVQGLLGHTDIRTTRRFYAPVLLARLHAAVNRVPAKLVPAAPATPRANTPQKGTRRTNKKQPAVDR